MGRTGCFGDWLVGKKIKPCGNYYLAPTGIQADVTYGASITHRWPLAGPAEIGAFFRGSRKQQEK